MLKAFILLALSFLLTSAPAHAGRGSGCMCVKFIETTISRLFHTPPTCVDYRGCPQRFVEEPDTDCYTDRSGKEICVRRN